ncbi:hypothetical protein GOP47_0023107 [Adiantum capillus-veneris]|uniref:FAF domain-containing protein n=1 Tax=Adiantum capillus-veneris TaxID=13818 RepID=A0A9D4U7R9_ADICA|nr:hypothetical protein GOP47_0023107 [Adiantum capillus-veneris]
MSLEDYWEDASVCVGCDPHRHRWFSASFLEEKEQKPVSVYPRDNTLSVVPPSGYHDMQADSPLPRLPPPRSPQQFPPPIALCSTLSIKQGGRFVLKDMCAMHPPNCSCLRAERRHGRLRLHLIETHEQLHSAFSCDEDKGMKSSFSSFSVCVQPLDRVGEHREEFGQAFNAEDSATSKCSGEGIDGESSAAENQVSYNRLTSTAHVSPLLQDDDIHESKDAGCAGKELGMRGSIDADMEKSAEELEHAGTTEDVLNHVDNCIQKTFDGKPNIVWSASFDQVGNVDMDVQSSLNSPYSSNQVLLQQSFARAGTVIGLAAVS